MNPIDAAALAAADQAQADIIVRARAAYADYCLLNPEGAVTLTETEDLILGLGISLGMNAAFMFLHDAGAA